MDLDNWDALEEDDGPPSWADFYDEGKSDDPGFYGESEDLEGKAELGIKLVLPLLNESTGSDNETALDSAR